MTSVLNHTQHHNKCICQICTCHKHHCPHCDPQLPFEGNSTYAKDYHKHPIYLYKIPKEKGPDLDRHYDYINSKYRQDYPGYKVGPVEKHKPKNPDQANLPFYGTSDYRSNFGPKKAQLQKPTNKGKNSYEPTGPFNGSSTYKSDFVKKSTNPHPKRKVYQADFPPGYKFNGDTTYKSDFVQKPLQYGGSFKPNERVGQTGPHDLQTIYRQQYTQKQIPCRCPILDLPQYSGKIKAPYSHYGYDATRNLWFQKN